jgi:Predicted membrane protein (DUF2079)
VKGVPNLLGDHFHPALMALAPAYWIWDDARVLLVVQALLLAVASLPIFYWARPRLGIAGALSVQLAFLAFWGLLAGAIFDFHELALAVPAISFGLYALLERRRWLFWSMFAVGCLSKEDIALTFAAMGLYALFVQRRPRFGLAVCTVGFAWFAVTVSAIMPAISGHRYHYWDYPSLGPSWTRAPFALVRHPGRAATQLVDRAVKRHTLAALFGAWLFLPLASPLLLVALPTLAERFWAKNPAFWTTRFQYSLPLAPILAYAAVDAASRLRSLSRPAAFGALAAGLVLCAAVVRPLAGLTGYMSAGRAAATDACLDRIPANAPVAASGRLIPHLTHRLHVYRLGHRRGEQYWPSRATGRARARCSLQHAPASRSTRAATGTASSARAAMRPSSWSGRPPARGARRARSRPARAACPARRSRPARSRRRRLSRSSLARRRCACRRATASPRR